MRLQKSLGLLGELGIAIDEKGFYRAKCKS